jgi:hypothetical protein
MAARFKVILEDVAEEYKSMRQQKHGSLINCFEHWPPRLSAKASKRLSVYEVSVFTSTYQPPPSILPQDGLGYGHITCLSLAETFVLDCILEHPPLSPYTQFLIQPYTPPFCFGYGLL